jgi:hypothetical protein
MWPVAILQDSIAFVYTLKHGKTVGDFPESQRVGGECLLERYPKKLNLGIF